ncbi:hypothetical protein L6452_39989 [Arctium lappa]|uniref:Uncharacterized protein n=1 Tax=Arctium lappa TaxID=4217 RepID=A0ACB8XU22_ARCLA|nr:hypothetical protein L6452_39989 [Arctium lappa]
MVSITYLQEYEGVLTSSGAEDLSSLRQPMISHLQEPKMPEDFFQTHYTFLTKSTLQNKVTPRQKVHPVPCRRPVSIPCSTGVSCIKCMRHYKYDGCFNMQDQPALLPSSSLSVWQLSLYEDLIVF